MYLPGVLLTRFRFHPEVFAVAALFQVVRPRGLGSKEEHSGRSVPGCDEPQKRLLLRKSSPTETLRYVRLPDSGRRRPHHGRLGYLITTI